MWGLSEYSLGEGENKMGLGDRFVKCGCAEPTHEPDASER